MSEKEILKLANDLIVAHLQDRNSVYIPCMGQFTPVFQPEYILLLDGERKLMPPSVAMSYMPSEYLLRSQHYTTLDFTPPQAYFEQTFIGNLADLHNLDERAVEFALVEHCKTLLGGLFRGRRVAFLDLGDLYVTEEVEGVLLLNFVPHPDLIKALNFVFSAYKPTSLKQDAVLENTEVRYSEPEEKLSQHIISHPTPIAQEPEVTESEGITEANDEANQQASEDITKGQEEVIGKKTPPITEEVYEYKHTKGSSKPNLTWLYILLALVLVGVVFYFTRRPRTSVSPMTPTPQVVEPIDTTPQQHLEPTLDLPLDTVTVANGGTLAKLATEYYHNNFYWVYIYMANKDSIPNPNILSPGQIIVIPPLEWYDLKSDPDEALHEAKEWSKLILSEQYSSFEKQRDSLKPFKKVN